VKTLVDKPSRAFLCSTHNLIPLYRGKRTSGQK
jgi:hypothetical protein